MNGNPSPFDEGSRPTPSSVPIEDDQLYRTAINLTCPNCGDVPLDVVRLLSPDEVDDESVETYKGAVGGAVAGGAVGAVAGPVGIAIGAAGGALFGGSHKSEQVRKQRLVTSCSHCGHHGRGT